MIKFAQRIKELRSDRKLKQSELAEALEVDQSTISSWESGYREPDFERLSKIAKFFEVTTDYLLGLED